jgi:acetyl esterase/lipase
VQLVDLTQAPVHAGCHQRRGVPFSTPTGHQPVHLDLYRPAGVTGALPLVVLVHGGGWAVGDRGAFGPAFEGNEVFTTVARAGCVVASLDYRLSDVAVFPAQIDDVLAGLAWLGGATTGLGADPARTVLWGESAGGHLASLAALDATAARSERAALRVVGSVAWYGPSDLTTMGAQARDDAVVRATDPGSREERLLGMPVAKAGPRASAASPVAHVHPAAPPFLLMHGDVDRFVPVQQSQQLYDALRGVGVEARLEVVPGADHMWRGTDAHAVLRTTMTWIGQVTSG